MSRDHKLAENYKCWAIRPTPFYHGGRKMKSGSLRENLVKEVEDTFDDLFQSVDWIKDLIKSGETGEQIIEALDQLQMRLLK